MKEEQHSQGPGGPGEGCVSLASALGAGQNWRLVRCRLGPVSAGLRVQCHEPQLRWQELAKTSWPRGLLPGTQTPGPHLVPSGTC